MSTSNLWAGVTNLKIPAKGTLKRGIESAWLYGYSGKGKFTKDERKSAIKKGETFEIVAYGDIGGPCRGEMAYLVKDRGWICASVVKLLSVPEGENVPVVTTNERKTPSPTEIKPTAYNRLIEKVKKDISKKETGHSVQSLDDRFKKWASKQLAQSVAPEVETPVFISRDQISRINCPGTITKVVYPTDKGVEISKDEHNVYVRIDPHVPASEFPLELYVTCDGRVYPMIAKVKSDIPAQKIMLATIEKKVTGSSSPLEVSRFEEKVMKILRRVYRKDYLCSWEVEEFSERLTRELTWLREVKTGIDGLRVSVFSYKPRTRKRVDEKMALGLLKDILLDSNLVAVSLSDLGTVSPGSTIQIYAVFRKTSTAGLYGASNNKQ